MIGQLGWQLGFDSDRRVKLNFGEFGLESVTYGGVLTQMTDKCRSALLIARK